MSKAVDGITGYYFHQLSANYNHDEFQRDWDTVLNSANTRGVLIVVVYLGGASSSLSSIPSPLAEIGPLHRSRWQDMRYMPWDPSGLHKSHADVLFISNFASGSFLRYLLSTRPDESNGHRLELVTFTADKASDFANSLQRFFECQRDLERLHPLGYTIATLCQKYGAGDTIIPEMSVFWVGNRDIFHRVRQDVLEGTQPISLAPERLVFTQCHHFLLYHQFKDLFRHAKIMDIPQTGSRAEIWEVALDYQTGNSDPKTVLAAVKRFIPQTATDQRIFKDTFEDEVDNPG